MRATETLTLWRRLRRLAPRLSDSEYTVRYYDIKLKEARLLIRACSCPENPGNPDDTGNTGSGAGRSAV